MHASRLLAGHQPEGGIEIHSSRVAHAALVALAALAAAGTAGAQDTVTGHAPVPFPIRIEGVEVWRIDTETEETLIGLPVAAVFTGTETFVLDRQLARVIVFDEEGRITRTIGRRGEGPGELRDPRDLVALPGGRIGVLDGFPARIAVFTEAGEPVERHEITGDATGTPRALALDAGPEDLVLSLNETRVSGDVPVTRFRLVRASFGGRIGATLLERDLAMRGGRTRIDEADIPHTLWAVGPHGRVYAVTDRARYAVAVFAPDGREERTIERAYERRARTKAEVDARRTILSPPGFEGTVRVLEHEPDITALRPAPDGALWVASSRSTDDLPDGVHQRWDVYDRDGRDAAPVHLALEIGVDDEIRFLERDRVVVFEGYHDVVRSLMGGGGPDEADAAALEIVLYALTPVSEPGPREASTSRPTP